MPSLEASFPSAFMGSRTSYGAEHPFAQLGSPVLAISPPNFLPTPSLLNAEERESLEAVQALFSNNQNLGVLSALLQ